MFMANAHVGHDCVIGDNCILANSVPLAGHVTLDNWVIIGGLDTSASICSHWRSYNDWRWV